jgi:N-methylhydantoinase A
MTYLVGIDIGGTFTDCAIVDGAGKLLTTKVPSTPQDFSRGMMDALGAGAQALGVSLDDFCRDISFLSHGTTVGTNTIIQKRGAKVGLITTKGHEDAIHIMRGSRGYAGRDIRKVVHFPETSKPAPIVPKRLVRGVSERVDCFGEVVVELNQREAEAAIHELLAEGVQALAICFLWSFRNPAHENQVKAMVQRLAPQVFVTTSVDIAPKWGEYERVTATALNAYLGPVMGDYLARLDSTLQELGYAHGLQITQCGGGTVPVARAGEAPLLTLDSGPVSGVTASMFLGAAMGEKNVITTDMGGTSFDVSIIYEGKPAYSFISNTDQYEYFLPKVDLQAIGAGGGSLARAHPETRTLTVGPDSAGAFPGPVCYGRGGSVPTVTDAQLVLGYLDPDNFAGGRMSLNKPAAMDAIGALGSQIGMSAIECAAGICRIVELHMADIIRKVTVEKGFDPRDFVLFAFGGAGCPESRHPAKKGRVHVVRLRRRGGRRAAHPRAHRDHAHARAGEAHQRPDRGSRNARRAADEVRGHRGETAALRVLARRAAQGADQRSGDPAAVDAAAGRFRSRAEKIVRQALRAALWPRLRASRRAARDRRLPPARQGAHAAAEARRLAQAVAAHSKGGGAQEARHLLAGSCETQGNAGL